MNTCVQCENSAQCSGASPICDSTNVCRGCENDTECPSNVCDTNSGLCIDESTVLYSAPSGSDSASCSRVDPCSITHAFAIADTVRDTVKLATGTYSADLSITNKTLSLHGDGATLTPLTSASAFLLTLDVGAHVHVIGASIVGNTTSAIKCGPFDSSATPMPSIDLDNVSIDSAGFIAMVYPCKLTARNSHFNARVQYPAFFVVQPSTATFDRCVFEGAGVQALGGGAVARVTNSLFTNQIATGVPSDPGPFIGTTGGGNGAGQAFVSFSTFVNTRILSCGSGLPGCAGGSDDGACIDNSIIVSSAGDAVTGTGCHVSYSLVMPQAAALNGTNNLVNVDPLFVSMSLYELKSSSPAVDAADPAAVDSIDLAGTPRPQGARNDIGAYEYKP